MREGYFSQGTTALLRVERIGIWIGLALQTIAPQTIAVGVNDFNSVAMTAVRAVKLIANFRFKIGMAPPAIARLAGKVIEILQRNLHATVVKLTLSILSVGSISGCVQPSGGWIGIIEAKVSQNFDTAGDRAEMSDFVAMRILRRKAETGRTGNMAELLRDRGIAAKTTQNCVLDLNLSRCGSLSKLLREALIVETVAILS